jgi:hypothetical protein
LSDVKRGRAKVFSLKKEYLNRVDVNFIHLDPGRYTYYYSYYRIIFSTIIISLKFSCVFSREEINERVRIEILNIWKSQGHEAYLYSPTNVEINDILNEIKSSSKTVQQQQQEGQNTSVSKLLLNPELKSLPGIPLYVKHPHSSLNMLFEIGTSKIFLGMLWYILHVSVHNFNDFDNNSNNTPDPKVKSKTKKPLLLTPFKKTINKVGVKKSVSDDVTNKTPDKNKIVINKDEEKLIKNINFTHSSVSGLLFSILRLLNFTLDVLDMININDEKNKETYSLYNNRIIHPLSIPFTPSSPSSPLAVMVLEALFMKHPCGCEELVSSSSSLPSSSLSSSSTSADSKNESVSIASLIYQYYISSFHLSFPFSNESEGGRTKKNTFPNLNAEFTSKPLMAGLISRILHRLRYFVCYYFGTTDDHLRSTSTINIDTSQQQQEEEEEKGAKQLKFSQFLNQIGVISSSSSSGNDLEMSNKMDGLNILSDAEKKKLMKEKAQREMKEEMKRKQKAFMEKMGLEDEELLEESQEMKKNKV